MVWVPGDTNRGGGGPVWVASYDGTVVRGPDNVTESTAVLANRPHISVSPKGSVIVSWGIDADKSIHLRIRDVQGSWGAIETVSTGLGGDEPAAFMDKAGNIHVVFSDEVGVPVYALSKINGAWENALKLSTGFGQHGSPRPRDGRGRPRRLGRTVGILRKQLRKLLCQADGLNFLVDRRSLDGTIRKRRPSVGDGWDEPCAGCRLGGPS